MSDQTALLAAIVAHPDEDMPRLIYADWLDENLPDATPSPAVGPSARAEYIRVQCRLARYPFDDPDYPELLEREQDLADWLRTHAKHDPSRPGLPKEFKWSGNFDSGQGRAYDRGFPEQFIYEDYDDEAEVNVTRILAALPKVLETATTRSLMMEDAYGEEIAGLVSSPAIAGLRGLSFFDVFDDNPDDFIRALAASRHLGGLRHLELSVDFMEDDLRRLGKAKNLRSLESLWFDTSAGFKSLGEARWFRGLRSLRVSMNSREAFTSLAELPRMPNLVSLTMDGLAAPTLSVMRKFAASESFPRLARLEIRDARLNPEHVAALARGPWPLRHLTIHDCVVRKAGAEALAGAEFAESLRVLELSECEITAGGVQALAGSAKLAGLKHLNLNSNPIGISGLAAIARGEHFRGLRSLMLSNCNSASGSIDAASVWNFLTALEMSDLRHLRLDLLPVGVRGARVIGSGGTFANLTRLDLTGCGLREKGARAIVGSDSLSNLVSLDLANNTAGKGVSKLADASTLPRLAYANVCRNRVPSWTLSRLRKRPGVHV